MTSVGDGLFKTAYTYDGYDRLSSRKVYVGPSVRQELEYTYDSTSEYQTGRIASIYNPTTGKTQNYTYNNQGYVTGYSIALNADNRTYSYDSAGRLSADESYRYVYDDYNNVEKIKLKSDEVVKAFTYDAANHTRLIYLTENGVNKYFAYDSMGNMTTYKGSVTTSPQNLYWTRGNMLLPSPWKKSNLI